MIGRGRTVPSAKQRRARAVAKGRDKRREARARATQAAQREAERRRLSPTAHQRRRLIGWTLVVLAVAVGVTHWLSHLGTWDFASQGVEDLIAGYPMAAVLGVGGAIVLSR